MEKSCGDKERSVVDYSQLANRHLLPTPRFTLDSTGHKMFNGNTFAWVCRHINIQKHCLNQHTLLTDTVRPQPSFIMVSIGNGQTYNIPGGTSG